MIINSKPITLKEGEVLIGPNDLLIEAKIRQGLLNAVQQGSPLMLDIMHFLENGFHIIKKKAGGYRLVHRF